MKEEQWRLLYARGASGVTGLCIVYVRECLLSAERARSRSAACYSVRCIRV